jgi:excisionase family DNA binding protein
MGTNNLPPHGSIRINQVHEGYPWSRSTTYRLVAEGRLPARKLGSATLILVEDLESFIANLDEVVR